MENSDEQDMEEIDEHDEDDNEDSVDHDVDEEDIDDFEESDDDDDDERPFQNPLDRGNEYIDKLTNRDSCQYHENSSPLSEWLSEMPWEKVYEHSHQFDYWELLPVEIKFMIIKKTDFVTSFSLMFTSKRNYEIARSVPMMIRSFKIEDSGPISLKTIGDVERPIKIELKSRMSSRSQSVTLIFEKENEDDTKVTRQCHTRKRRSFDKSMILKNCNYLKESELFVTKLLALTDKKVWEFEVRSNNWGGNMNFINQVKILKELTIWNFLTATPFREFQLDHETIRYAKSVSIRGSNTISDECFLDLNCEEIHTRGVYISNKAINTFVKRWINGGGQENFSSFEAYECKNVDETVILENIDCLEWDDDFKMQNSILSEWLSWSFDDTKYYYIENKDKSNGATLGIGANKVVFYITGKRWKLDTRDPLLLLVLLQNA